MKFLQKIGSLPEKKRRIIFWAVLAILAASLLVYWTQSIPQRLNNFQKEAFTEQLSLPEITMPDIPDFPDLDKIEQNGTTTEEIKED